MIEHTNEEIWDRLVALSDRIADLERRASEVHSGDYVHRDAIASIKTVTSLAFQASRERRRLNERIAALEEEQS